MGHRCCGKQKVKRGLWSPEEDEKLIRYITTHGHGSWSSVPKEAVSGLQRCGKSCRLRWINYLRPELKRGSFSAEEEQIIIDVHRILGNRWAQIAKHLPGRTDNEVKNFWNSCIKKKLISRGLDPKTHNLIPSHKRTTSKIACSISVSHQQPFSVISLNSQMKDVSMEISPPILTLPSHSPTDTSQLIRTTSAPLSISVYQNPNTPWTINAQTCNDSVLSSIPSIENTPISPAASSSVNPSVYVLGDENPFGINSIVEPYVSRSMEGMQSQELENQPTEKICYTQADKSEKAKPAWDVDASFDASSFDLGFVDSPLLSGSTCRDFCSMDGLAWNF